MEEAFSSFFPCLAAGERVVEMDVRGVSLAQADRNRRGPARLHPNDPEPQAGEVDRVPPAALPFDAPKR